MLEIITTEVGVVKNNNAEQIFLGRCFWELLSHHLGQGGAMLTMSVGFMVWS
jgi:hypothetical protein